MHTLLRTVLVAGLVLPVGACQRDAKKTEESENPAQNAATAAVNGTQRQQSNNNIPPPMDVSEPPADAVKTESGLAYKVLAEGTGDKPNVNDTAMVNYTGWRTTGEMFYSTQRRGSPQPMSLSQVAPGWGEALRDMKVGEKRLYWMPPELATRGKAPDTQPLVFEIEVTGIEKAPPVPEDVAAPPADATKTKSGLAYKVLEKGTGKDKPRLWDQVTVHYTVWMPDGKMLDSTSIRKRPRPMQLFRESKGWAEAIQQMVEGEKIRAWIPGDLLEKKPGAPEGGLTVDFELVSLKKMNNPPPVPKDVAKPPASAKKTEQGVFYKVLKKGKGKDKPTADKTVKVHYTGWTTDGRMFDSSIVRGQPAQFPLRAVIPGWTDGLQTMVEGQTSRFWIPEELAYKGRAGRPAGMLVFDVELLEIMGSHPMLPPGHEKLTGKPGQKAGGHGKPAGGHGKPAGGHGKPAGGHGKPAGGHGKPAGGQAEGAAKKPAKPAAQ